MLPRGQVVSKVWDYIRKHNLQNPADKREILADDKLKKVFGRDKCTMFEMNKYLGAAPEAEPRHPPSGGAPFAFVRLAQVAWRCWPPGLRVIPPDRYDGGPLPRSLWSGCRRATPASNGSAGFVRRPAA